MANQNPQKTVTRSRAKYALPDAARGVIDLVNSIPATRMLPPLSKIREMAGGDANEMQRLVRERLDGVTSNFITICGSPETAYHSLRTLRRALRDLANLAAAPESLGGLMRFPESQITAKDRRKLEKSGVVFFGENEPNEYRLLMPEFRSLESLHEVGGPGVPGYTVALKIGGGGKIELKPDAIVGMNLERLAGVIADRLRICRNPNCRRLFYARQDNMDGCGMARCRDVIRQRRCRKNRKIAQMLERKKARK